MKHLSPKLRILALRWCSGEQARSPHYALRIYFCILFSVFCIPQLSAQTPKGRKSTPMERKMDLLVRLDNPSTIIEHNREIKIATDKANATARMADGQKGEFMATLAKGFGTTLVQKSQNATTNLMSLGVSYLVEAMKSDSKKWYTTAQSHCTLSRKLKSKTTIEDFYSAPSSLGAMDPQNIQFKGFGCHHYLEERNKKNYGEEVFFIFCSMRKDSLGISSIVNHSKFLVELDSLVFNPKYCGLPNDSLETLTPFDFSKRSDLTLTVKARIYSSWINEAIMVTNDQQLGEFTITARIDPTLLNSDSVFVYRKDDPRYAKLVSVTGDSFIVPRSFTGTADGTTYSSTWGTGQYRIEMDVTQSCRIIDKYYYKEKYLNEDIDVRESGNGSQIAFAGIPEFKKFDKAKWQAEWTPIKQRKRKTPFLQAAWSGIVTAYKGTGWVQTFTDPLTSTIVNYQGKKLNNWLELTTTNTSAASAAAKQGSAGGGTSSAGANMGGKVPGGKQ